MTEISKSRRALMRMASIAAIVAGTTCAAPAGAVVVNNGLTPTQALDPNNITGVGQMVVDEKNGFIGLCTATLINPRTVIFAAHCVNENPAGNGFEPATGYGAKSGGLPIGFFFNASNNAAGNSAIGHWLNGVNGVGKDTTRTADFAYNSNYVWYNPASTTLGLGNNFLQGDVALAALDTPAANIPTWTLMFSPITSAQHVTIDGYGANGTGTAGSTGAIDYRRRIAENMVSLLGSLDDQDKALFGAADGLPQNLYQLDFNDPKYGKTGASPYDFNIFNDAALPREGITGPGDSGGPLIVDQAYSKPVIIGVLSGSDRFYSAQPAGSYGTTAFYQPLYLFWDLIVANNPYKYVGALAGDGKWTDPTHWVINIDPNYVSLDANGKLVNALPTAPGAGVAGTSPKFGQVCFAGDCIDIATGAHTINGKPADGVETLPGGSLSSAPAVVSTTQVSEGGVATGADAPTGSTLSTDETTAQLIAAADAFAQALAAPTVANGLPGATNFVPNDTDGSPSTGVAPRYYDVTLSQAGTTTLDVPITVDRLTIAGSSATLNITSAGSLTSLIDTTVTAGTLNVDGRYTSAGDIALIGGLLSGSGIVNAGHTVSVLGAIAPGGLGKIGTLTFQGDVILSSGDRLFASIGAGNTASLLVSQANAAQGTLGTVNLGGLLAISPVAGYIPHYGDNFLVVSAQNAVTGSFSAITAISAGVLFPQVVQTAKTVSVLIQAASYNTVINPNSQIQRNYAALLDGSRSAYAQLSDLYAPLDVMAPAVVQPTLEALAPFHANEVRELATMSADALSGLYRSRIEESRAGSGAPGTLSVIGQPLQIAGLDPRYQPGVDRVGSDAQSGGSNLVPTVTLPAGMNAYIAGGYLDGSGRSTPTLLGGKDALDGYYVALGGEAALTRTFTLGASIGFTQTSAGTLGLSKARQTLTALAVYGAYRLPDGYFVTGEASAGGLNSKTTRQLPVGGTVFNLRAEASGSSLTSEFQVGRDLVMPGASRLTLTPLVGLRYQHFDSGRLDETGGGAALVVERQNLDALQGRLGLNLKGDYATHDLTIVPRVSLAYVHSFAHDGMGDFASLAGGPATPVLFDGPSQTKDWGELGGNVTLKGKGFDLTLAANTNLGRKDLDFQTYSASVRIRF